MNILTLSFGSSQIVIKKQFKSKNLKMELFIIVKNIFFYLIKILFNYTNIVILEF